jgi:hypothetical protein
MCACSDAPLAPPSGEQVKYVVSRVILPTSNTQARELGVDLDGDNNNDNQLGMVISFLSARGVGPGEHVDEMINRGEPIMLATLQFPRASDPDDTIGLTLLEGTDPVPTPCVDAADTTCGRHLQGSGQFVASPTPNLALLAEWTAARPFTVGPDALTVSIPLYSDVVTFQLAAARVRVTVANNTMLAGAIGGGLSTSELNTKLLPSFKHYIEERIARECTPSSDPTTFCGCPLTMDEYDARYWLATFDTSPKDCVLSDDEIIHNQLVVSLLAPGVQIDGVFMLSIGFGFDAVRASF